MKRLKLILTLLVMSCLTPSVAMAKEAHYKDVLIYMKDDIHKEADELAGSNSEDYIEKLSSLADQSQKDLKDFLETREGVKEYESFFISNLIYLMAEEDVIKEVEKREDVALVEPAESSTTSSFTTYEGLPNSMNWNMDVMNIKQAKEKYGLTGKGVTIGFIDSAVDFDHPEIRPSLRGMGPGRAEPDSYSYIDVLNTDIKERTHATGVVSVALGMEGGYVSGVAPGAEWILARTFDEKSTSNELVLKAAQWMVAPGGEPEKRPDIINNSWGGNASGERWFEDILLTWDRLGIFSVFASGNDLKAEQKPGSIENPASLPGAFSVGSIGEDKSLSNFSKTGPSKFSPNIIKPEIVGPGENIITALPDGKYGISRGTSLATPHISGLAALIKEQRPDASNLDIRRIIIESSQGLTSSKYPTSPNMGFGYGLPDALRALDLADQMKTRERIQGDNRFDTSVRISKAFFKEGAKTAYITNGFSYIDALVMSSLTGLEEGPLLLSDTDKIDKGVKDELKRLGVKKVVIIGGENTISSRLEEELARDLSVQTERLAGENRFDTSVKIASKLSESRQIKEVYLVNAGKEVDAISASGPAKKGLKPVLLSGNDALDPGVKDFLDQAKPELVNIIGGPTSISKELEEELQAMGFKTQRFGGDNRYQTSVMLAEASFEKSPKVFLASGINLADALTAGPVSGSLDMPVLLSGQRPIAKESLDYMNKTGVKKVIILGGENSISEDLEDRLLFQ